MTSTVAPIELDVVRIARGAAEVLAPYGARESVLTPDLALRTQEEDGDLIASHLRMFHVPGLGELRTIALISERVSAMQLVAVPRPDRDVGVFVAEFCVGEGAPRVVVDVHAVVATRGAAEAATRVLDRARRAVPELEGRLEPAKGFGRSRHALVGPGPEAFFEPFVHLCQTAWALHVYEMVLAPTLDMRKADDHFVALQGWKRTMSGHLPLRRTLDAMFDPEWTHRLLSKHFLS